MLLCTLIQEKTINPLSKQKAPGLQTLLLQNKVQNKSPATGKSSGNKKINTKQIHKSQVKNRAESSATQARRPGKMAGSGLALCAKASFFLDYSFQS